MTHLVPLKRFNSTSIDPLSFLDHKDELLVSSFDGLFDQLFGEVFPDIQKAGGGKLFSKGAYPKVDVIEESDRVIISAEIPGITKDQVSIEVQDDMLTIKGEKREDEQKTKPGKYLYKELKRSSFQRSFVLDKNLKKDDIVAKFENGMLEIVLKKEVPSPPEKPPVRKVEIK